MPWRSAAPCSTPDHACESLAHHCQTLCKFVSAPAPGFRAGQQQGGPWFMPCLTRAWNGVTLWHGPSSRIYRVTSCCSQQSGPSSTPCLTRVRACEPCAGNARYPPCPPQDTLLILRSHSQSCGDNGQPGPARASIPRVKRQGPLSGLHQPCCCMLRGTHGCARAHTCTRGWGLQVHGQAGCGS